jgi:hypothetical protein
MNCRPLTAIRNPVGLTQKSFPARVRPPIVAAVGAEVYLAILLVHPQLDEGQMPGASTFVMNRDVGALLAIDLGVGIAAGNMRGNLPRAFAIALLTLKRGLPKTRHQRSGTAGDSSCHDHPSNHLERVRLPAPESRERGPFCDITDCNEQAGAYRSRVTVGRAILIAILVLSPMLESLASGKNLTPEPASLIALRAAYAKELSGAAAPQLEKYREALLRLERGAVDQRDYQTAAQARKERLKVEQRLSLPASRPDSPPPEAYPGGPISLAAANAKPGGGVTYNREKDSLEGWKARGASARWALPYNLKAGGYEVILEIACGSGSGGQVTIKEDFHSLTKNITPTRSWDDFSSQTLGTLRVKANSIGLNLTAVTVEGDGLFLLRGVRLVPTAPDAR